MATERPRIGVGAIAVRARRLLMVRRGNELARGLWSLPGGHLETGEYIAQAVRREVAEETGLEVRVGDLVGIFEVPGEPHYVILDYLVEVAGDPTPTPGVDALEARWVDFDDVLQLRCTPRFVETLRGWGVLPSADEQRD
ncbi:MAG: NUDIX hydrolase [Actinomycetota bacterium]